VLALDDLSLARPESLLAGVEPVVADTCDTGALAERVAHHRPRTVFHLAAIHFVPACNADPPAALSVNVVGTQSQHLFVRRTDSIRSDRWLSLSA